MHYHSFAEIDLNLIRQNLRVLRSFLNSDTKFMAVVKADAYGHGAVQVAQALEKETEWFAVVTVREALELREAGIRNPVLVLGPPVKETAGLYPAHDLTAVISDPAHFDILEESTHYHLEFDSGMGRLGFLPQFASEVEEKIRQYPQLKPGGMMTHLATADEPGPGREKVLEQLQCFDQIRSRFAGYDLMYHAANTAGVTQYPDSRYDMVRCGIGIYGYDPAMSENTDLKPAMKWKSRLGQCKPVKKGMTISYGATWTVPEDGFLGIVPAGYADGFRRNLSGKVSVLIDGKYYPLAGRVTMDFIMIFLGSDKIETGAEVILMGETLNTADEWARQSDTISYEILCGLHKRVEKVYK